MEKVEWSPQFATGIEEIDRQHKTLIDKFNEFIDTYREDPQKVMDMMETLVNYIILHFDTEEKYMEKYEYPDKGEHIKEHREFTKIVNKMADDFMVMGPSPELEEELYENVGQWIVRHILQVDKKLGAYLKDRIKK